MSIKNEYNILTEYNGNGFCRVYEADLAKGVLLLERVMPGRQLRDEAYMTEIALAQEYRKE